MNKEGRFAGVLPEPDVTESSWSGMQWEETGHLWVSKERACATFCSKDKKLPIRHKQHRRERWKVAPPRLTSPSQSPLVFSPLPETINSAWGPRQARAGGGGQKKRQREGEGQPL
ncbi:unnamed protein product [Caretta caretta]